MGTIIIVLVSVIGFGLLLIVKERKKVMTKVELMVMKSVNKTLIRYKNLNKRY
jgi:hypothetical protein